MRDTRIQTARRIVKSLNVWPDTQASLYVRDSVVGVWVRDSHGEVVGFSVVRKLNAIHHYGYLTTGS